MGRRVSLHAFQCRIADRKGALSMCDGFCMTFSIDDYLVVRFESFPCFAIFVKVFRLVQKSLDAPQALLESSRPALPGIYHNTTCSAELPLRRATSYLGLLSRRGFQREERQSHDTHVEAFTKVGKGYPLENRRPYRHHEDR